MFPGNGSVVAGVSGRGVHDSVGYCGHGGGGGLIARAARCCAISLASVGMKIGCASALAATTSVIATVRAAIAATVRRCLDKLTPVVLDGIARRSPGATSRQRTGGLKL